MPDAVLDVLWYPLPAFVQDLLIFAGLLAPLIVVAAVLWRGFAFGPLLRAMLWRYRGTNAVFVVLIALAVGVGAALIAQERGIREGTARAADGFDLIVAAPGSEITVLLAAVYLQPSDVALIEGPLFSEIESHPRVRLAAPLAYGDSWEGRVIVGTIAPFIDHLSGPLAEGRLFEIPDEGVVGARVPLALGDEITPAHGFGEAADTEGHLGTSVRIVGRMAPTGTPWDEAILVPVEQVWITHGLANGHAPDKPLSHIGPPYSADHFPGTPAVLVVPEELYMAFSLQSTFTRPDAMAFLPGAVLSQLLTVLGDVRAAMSALALVTQGLVAVAVIAGLLLLTRLFARQLALLRALGAPGRFIFGVVWSYATVLIVVGAVLGLIVAALTTGAVSSYLTAQTGILIEARLRWPELHLAAGFVSAASLIALLPGWRVLRRNLTADLRG
ncbi:MAG: ABC transporter permease [Pseudomonadota bacterium]